MMELAKQPNVVNCVRASSATAFDVRHVPGVVESALLPQPFPADISHGAAELAQMLVAYEHLISQSLKVFVCQPHSSSFSNLDTHALSALHAAQ